MRRDFLESLGLDPSGKHTTTDIKKAWRKLCLEHHPDRGGDVRKFQKITHSYKMLTDNSYRHSEDARKEGPKGGLNINLTVPMNFEDAFFGREVNVTYNVVELDNKGAPIIGKEYDVICITIKVPAGSFSYSHRIIGKGLKKGEEQGDTFIIMQSMSHPKYSIDSNGADVVSTENVPLDIMLKGGDLDVMTMWGLRSIKVPPGSREGDSIYIQKCGIRQLGRHKVSLKTIYPTKEELKRNANWKGLNIDWEVEEDKEDPQAEQDKEFHTLFDNLRRYSIDTSTGDSL